jgi:aryl-alcohol dehydrogenase-like predicted oxidoreductase
MELKHLSAEDVSLPPVGISACRLSLAPNAPQRLEEMLQQGIRLFLSFPSHDDGAAEALLGSATAEDAVYALSTLGLLEGGLYQRALERERSGNPYPELVRLSEGVSHCLHPEFLQEQLAAAEQRLGRRGVAGILLQRPELFLQWALQRGIPLQEVRRELFLRLERAFAALEAWVHSGRIRFYGVLSESFHLPATDPLFLSAAELLELARSVAGAQHHFRLLALPLNLFEHSAATEPNHGQRTVLEYALSAGLQVLAYRPLNAVVRGRRVRLSEPPLSSSSLVSLEHIRAQLREFVHTEAELVHALVSQLQEPYQRELLRESLTLGLFLEEHWQQRASYEDWEELRTGYLLERFRTVESSVRMLNMAENSLWQHYKERFRQALADIDRYYAARAWERARRLRELLHEAVGRELPPVPFARLAVGLVRATAGVTAVALASSAPEHGAELLAAGQLSLPTLYREHWQRLKAAIEVLERVV